jgi:hypothetical protein
MDLVPKWRQPTVESQVETKDSNEHKSSLNHNTTPLAAINLCAENFTVQFSFTTFIYNHHDHFFTVNTSRSVGTGCFTADRCRCSVRKVRRRRPRHRLREPNRAICESLRVLQILFVAILSTKGGRFEAQGSTSRVRSSFTFFGSLSLLRGWISPKSGIQFLQPIKSLFSDSDNAFPRLEVVARFFLLSGRRGFVFSCSLNVVFVQREARGRSQSGITPPNRI